MPQASGSTGLAFEDAMSVHVLRARGMIFSDLTCRFGANPARFHEILSGKLHPGSWERAVELISQGHAWNAEIAELVESFGRDRILAALKATNPVTRRFRQQLKRLRKISPPTPAASGNYSRRFLHP